MISNLLLLTKCDHLSPLERYSGLRFTHKPTKRASRPQNRFLMGFKSVLPPNSALAHWRSTPHHPILLLCPSDPISKEFDIYFDIPNSLLLISRLLIEWSFTHYQSPLTKFFFFIHFLYHKTIKSFKFN